MIPSVSEGVGQREFSLTAREKTLIKQKLKKKPTGQHLYIPKNGHFLVAVFIIALKWKHAC